MSRGEREIRILKRRLVALAVASGLFLSVMGGTAMAASEVETGGPVLVSVDRGLVAVVIITGFRDDPVIVTEQRNTVSRSAVRVDVALG